MRGEGTVNSTHTMTMMPKLSAQPSPLATSTTTSRVSLVGFLEPSIRPLNVTVVVVVSGTNESITHTYEYKVK